MSNDARVVSTPSSRKRKERRESSSQHPSYAKQEQTPDNRLLAGYLAYEFLTHGTIFGHPWDPATRADAAAKPRAYAAVAKLLKTDGAHIPGVLNPHQLSGWLQK